MGKRRPSGDGMVRKRENSRWEGRIVIGHRENGDSIFRYIYADSQKELTAKLRQNIEAYQGVDLTEDSRMTLAEWLDRWLEQVALTIRPSTLYHLDGLHRGLGIHQWKRNRALHDLGRRSDPLSAGLYWDRPWPACGRGLCYGSDSS